MPPGNGSGVSIGVNVNAQGAKKGLDGIGQGINKLVSSSKSLFSNNSTQQIQNYNRHLQQLERNLDRVTMRVKTLQGAQRQLLADERRAYLTKDPDEIRRANRAVTENERATLRWQARQNGAAAQVAFAQGNRAGIGGGGGGMAGWAANQFQQMAGGLGGTLLKALGVAELTKGAASIASKVFLSAVDEQKLLADILPRHQSSAGIGSLTSPKGLMNNFRDMGLPFGYSGLEGLKIAQAMGPGSGGFTALKQDTQTSMMMGRAFGIDAGGQASMLAEGGKMGAFVPGQARRFAEMLAREISVTGLGPRAQEVQEATLTLLHHQMALGGTTSPAAAMAMQTVLAKTGLPGLQGQSGAAMIGQMASTFGGASDDPTIAFTEAMLRDQRGVRGYYAMRRAKEDIAAGNDSRFIPDAIQEAYSLSPHEDAAKDLLSKVLGVPIRLLDRMGQRKKGGLRGFTAKEFTSTMGSLKKSGGFLDVAADKAMSLPGNQVREGEATINAVMARMGTPLVQMTGSLVQKASTEITHLMHIADSSHNAAEALGKIVGLSPKEMARVMPGQMATAKDGKGGFKQDALDKAANGITRPAVKAFQWFFDLGPYEKKMRHSATAPHLPAVPGTPVQRSSADGDHLHIHVKFDHTGAIHPQAQLAFEGMVETAIERIQHRKIRTNMHHRYSRVG